MATGCLSEGSSDKQQQARPLIWCYITLLMPLVLLVFTRAQSLSKAIFAHERALEWQELFDLAARTGMAESDIVATGYRVAGLHSF